MTIDRRQVLAGGASLLYSAAACARPKSDPFAPRLAALEQASGGRLGVMILDTESGRATGHRFGERFAMCSTFKLPLAAAILQASDKGLLNLDTIIPYTGADLVAHSPVTRANLAKGGMTIAALAEATQTTSDNAAANLLLRLLGGPGGFTGIIRAWGDPVTRIDRYEPDMNDVPDGEIRDTTTPEAFARTAARLLTSNVLQPASQERLIGWMVDTKTGAKRIRAGLPSGWRAGDKTGTFWGGNFNNKYNDVAIFWPAGRSPVIVSAYFEADGNYEDMRDADQAVLADVGRLAADWIRAMV